MRLSWDHFYLDLADTIALRSKDKSTKVGAVLVKDDAIISMGYNGMPRGVDDDWPTRQDRPTKYFYFEHAERNALYNAARHGIATLGSTLYTQSLPCADCARGVIQAGIARVCARWADFPSSSEKWLESCAHGRVMLKEAGVEIDVLLGEV